MVAALLGRKQERKSYLGSNCGAAWKEVGVVYRVELARRWAYQRCLEKGRRSRRVGWQMYKLQLRLDTEMFFAVLTDACVCRNYYPDTTTTWYLTPGRFLPGTYRVGSYVEHTGRSPGP